MEVHKDIMRIHAQFISNTLRKDWDWWTAFEGDEGVGKSTLAIWFAAYVSGKLFRIKEHICYDPDEFLECIERAPRYGSVIFDEAGEGWNIKAFATRTNRMLSNASQQVRDRNLNIILCLPSITILDKHGVRRLKNVVKVTAPNFERGFSEWCKVIKPKYGPMDYPYLPTQFFYNFIQLPTRQAEVYKDMKTTKARERMAKYIEAIKRDQGEEVEAEPNVPAYARVIEQVRMFPTKDELLTSRGTFDWRRIRSAANEKWKIKCSENDAKEAVFYLNKEKEAASLF